MPAPRPSVKGPSTSSRGSTISESNVAVVAPFQSDSTSEQNNRAPAVPQRLTSQVSMEGDEGSHGARTKHFHGPVKSQGTRVRRQHAYEEINLVGTEDTEQGVQHDNSGSTNSAAPLASFKPVRVAPPVPPVSVTEPEPPSPAFSTFGKSSSNAITSPQVKDNTQPSLAGTGATGGVIYAVPHQDSSEDSKYVSIFSILVLHFLFA